MRCLLNAVLVLCLAGCGTPGPLTTPGHDFSAHGRRVFVKPVELNLTELQFGEANAAPRPDWVAEAKPRLQEALAAALVEHGAEVVTDPAAAADYVLMVELNDWFNSPGELAAKTAFIIAMLPIVLTTGAPGNFGQSAPAASARASLTVQGTPEVAWQVTYTSGIPDVRKDGGAKAAAQFLLRELPWSQ